MLVCSRQAVVVLSSTESEYISLSRAEQQPEAMWMQSWMSEIGFSMDGPTSIHGDTLGSISLAETIKYHQLSKCIDIRWHYIRDHVREGNISIHSVSSKDNIADLLTKSLPPLTTILSPLWV